MNDENPKNRARRERPESCEALLRAVYGDDCFERTREEYRRAGYLKTRSWLQAAFKRTL